MLSINALAAGLWMKEPAALPPWADFGLVKTAIFHPSGSVKSVGPGCPAAAGVWHAWVTHRESPHDVLTREGGEKVGAALGKLLGCYKAVELDLEPMPAFRPDHAAFFSGVRATLPRAIELRLAVPPIAGSAHSLPGLVWTKADAEAALTVVDGLDFRVYDTGATTQEAYDKVLEATLAVAGAFPKKKNVVGLPAYTHGVKGRHRRRIENLAAASRVWRCGLEFAVYAAWTMTEEESRQAAGLVKKCNP